MPTVTAGVFTLTYTLRTTAAPGYDIQFGMDFTLGQTTTTALPLCQLIFPATAVGTNEAGVWNVDNHQHPSTSASCLIFAGADNGVITDVPTELSKRDKGILKTKFAVYRVDLGQNMVQTAGVTFGYSIDTGASAPVTIFTALSPITLPGDQRDRIVEQCSKIKFT